VERDVRAGTKEKEDSGSQICVIKHRVRLTGILSQGMLATFCRDRSNILAWDEKTNVSMS